MTPIKHDEDGFLLPRKEADKIETILANTEELLERQKRRSTPAHRRAVVVSVQTPRQVERSRPTKAAAVPPVLPRQAEQGHAAARPTPLQRRAEKERTAARQEQRKQTRLLENIAEQNKGGKGGLLSLLGMGAGLLKGLAGSPLNLAKGIVGGGKAAIRGADGRYLPKGAVLPSKVGRLAGLVKGMGKGGALAVLGGLFGGVAIEQSDMLRTDKNKAHAKNIIGVGGGLAGAAAGAKLGAAAGSVIPGAGTLIGGLLGGAIGAVAGTQLADYATDRLDKAIDPQLSQRMFGSWQGFTEGTARLWRGFTSNAGARWNSFTEAAQTGWGEMTGSLKTAGLYIWQEVLPKQLTDHFANLNDWGKQSWTKFSDAAVPYWESAKSFAQSAWRDFSAAAAPYWNSLKEQVGEAWESGKEAVGQAWEAAKQSDVGQAVGNAVNQGKATAQRLANGAKGAALSFLGYDMTKKYDHLQYSMRMGMKNKRLDSGYIDCSGWTFQVSKMEMESINEMLGFEKYKVSKNQAGMFNVGTHGSAHQIELAAKAHGVVTDSRGKGGFDVSKLQAGMLIGDYSRTSRHKGYSANIPGFGKSQYNHIVKVVRGKDGGLYISESSSQANGVTLTQADKWIKAKIKRGNTLTAVNPFGSDIGLLNGNIADVAGNEAKKAGRRIAATVGEGVARAADGLAAMFGKAGFNGRAKNKIIRETFADKGRAQAADRMMHGFGGGRIEGMSADDTAAYAAMVASTESGFNYRSLNQYGYAGAFQMGVAALEDIGLMKKGTAKRYKQSRAAMQNPNNWTVKGGLDAFLGSEAMQHKAFVDYTNKNIAYLRKNGLSDSQIGIGNFGQLAFTTKAAHLKGHGGATKLIRHGVDSRDANGQSAREYGQHAKESAHLFRTAAAAVRGGTVQARQPVRAQAALPPPPAPVRAKVPAAPQAVVVKAAAPAPQKTTGYAAAEGGGAVRFAHKPVGQTVSHAKIAWLASGGITSEKG